MVVAHWAWRLLALAIVLVPQALFAQDCSSPPKSGNDPHIFASALVLSLSSANEALEVRDAPTTEETPAKAYFEELTDFFYRIKAAKSKFRCAASLLEVFIKSDDEFIRGGASAISTVFTLLILNEEKFGELLKATFDRDPTSLESASFAEKVADHRLKMNETWKLLPKGVALSTYSLIEFSKETQKPTSTIWLTSAQRKVLLLSLEKEFGPKVREGAKAGQTSLFVSAALLYRFISDTTWRSASKPTDTHR